MTRTIRKTHYKNGERNKAWLRCTLSKRLRNKKKSKGHTPKDCWICW